LQSYALQTYGVALSGQEAEEWRQRLIDEIYPEIGRYLSDTAFDRIAAVMGCSGNELWSALDNRGARPGWLPATIMKIIGGATTKADGTPYNPRFLDGIWAGLVACCRNAELRPLLLQRKAGDELKAYFAESAVTLTGRVRAGVTYTAARNTPFQGLAADGAKLALFELVRHGYRVVAFVHDEFVIELPSDSDANTEAARIEEIVCSSMRQVLGTDLPVKAEYALATCWSKSAHAVYGQDGVLLPWQPLKGGQMT